MQTGWFKEVRVKDLDSHAVKALLASQLGSVDPHAVQNDRELPRDGDLGLAEADERGQFELLPPPNN